QTRRQQARASLSLLSQAALFVGWEERWMYRERDEIVWRARLDDDMLAVPGGEPVAWDGGRLQATSKEYGTLEFGTPLVELPIGRVTDRERDGYQQFREGYLNLWRRFFDPVGIRFRLGTHGARVEVYLLPLVNNSEYNQLRAWAGDGTV